VGLQKLITVLGRFDTYKGYAGVNIGFEFARVGEREDMGGS